MTWLVEERLPILLLGASAAAIMLVVVLQTRRLPAAIGFAAVVLVTIATLVVEALVVTEVERVENTIYAAADALENNEVDSVLAMIAPDATEMRRRAERILPDATFRRVKINNDLKVTINRLAQPPTAEARFTCYYEVEYRPDLNPYPKGVRRFEVTLVQDGDQWLFLGYEMTDPTGQGPDEP